MENNKIIVQGINFDRIDEYINIRKIRKEYRSDKRCCWLTALKYNSILIILFLLIIVGIVLIMIEYPPTSLAVGYWLSLMIMIFVGSMGFYVIGRVIIAVQNYGSELNTNYGFDWYFRGNHDFKYCLSNSNISKGTFFIKEGVKFKWQTEPNYVLCYINSKEKCDKGIQVINDDTIKIPKFDVLEMTLYIPKGYKMPTGEDVIYVNCGVKMDKVINQRLPTY